jgi:hypothetical protein
MRMRSRHSRRSVPIQRSAIAFARGACGGVWMMLIPAARKTASKASVNFVSRSRMRKRNCSARSVRSIRRFRALLGNPRPGRMRGDPGDVHTAGVVLDDDQHVEAAEEDGVDMGEVDGEDAVGLRGQELFPGLPCAARTPSGRRRCDGRFRKCGGAWSCAPEPRRRRARTRRRGAFAHQVGHRPARPRRGRGSLSLGRRGGGRRGRRRRRGVRRFKWTPQGASWSRSRR